MQLRESAASLSGVCRSVEARVKDIAELSELVLPIVLLPAFDSLPEVASRPSIRHEAAAYQLREERVVVNESIFPSFDADVAQAVLAHEIGHAICHRNAIMQRPAYKLLSECIVADLLACKWSFVEGLRKERLQSYGPKYCQILDVWQDEDQFVDRMLTYYRQRLSGLR